MELTHGVVVRLKGFLCKIQSIKPAEKAGFMLCTVTLFS